MRAESNGAGAAPSDSASDATACDEILRVEGLKKYFKVGKGVLHAVDGVSFSLRAGETLGVVGESGCGKTTLGRTAIGMYPKTAGISRYRGRDVHALKGAVRRAFTAHVQMIFQDPYASLDPKMRVGDIVSEGLAAHGMASSRAERWERAGELLESVGLDSSYVNRFIHEFSGGQRQRIGIARTLAVEPELVVCDEPISALDVSIQAQIVNLLERLQKEHGLTYLFIAHDLAMVRHISDRVMVLYLGQVMELAQTDELYERARHPYTQALLSAIPIPDPRAEASKQRIRLSGEIPSPIDPPRGCRFAGRCPRAREECRERTPELREIAPGHWVACLDA